MDRFIIETRGNAYVVWDRQRNQTLRAKVAWRDRLHHPNAFQDIRSLTIRLNLCWLRWKAKRS